jgi:hypothetical protein
MDFTAVSYGSILLSNQNDGLVWDGEEFVVETKAHFNGKVSGAGRHRIIGLVGYADWFSSKIGSSSTKRTYMLLDRYDGSWRRGVEAC